MISQFDSMKDSSEAEDLQRLRGILKSRGITQRSLSVFLDLSESAISRWFSRGYIPPAWNPAIFQILGPAGSLRLPKYQGHVVLEFAQETPTENQ